MKRALLAASVAAGLAIAQDAPKVQRDVIKFSAPVAGSVARQNLAFVSAEWVGPGGTVTGAPYAADTTTESIQTLADGNRIVNKSTSSFYRDSEGRTRSEMNIEFPGHPEESHKMIMINDPVAGYHYSLNTKEKTAAKFPMPPARNMANAPAKAEMGLTVAHPVPAALPAIGPGIAYARGGVMAARMPMQASEPQVEQLGKQVMEGVEVTGTMTTFTIPAGQMGNDRPLVSKSETWYSEELKAQILMKHSDARFGETTTRTTNIRRVEQPRDLFEVPSDYKVEEPKQIEKMMFEKRPPEEL